MTKLDLCDQIASILLTMQIQQKIIETLKMKEKKRVKSVVMGTPTIRALLIMASSLQEVFDLLLRTSETFDSQTWSNLTADSQLKSMGIMWGTSILLPFICELGLTSLYLLDNQRIKIIPKEHSLLYWWNRLKKDTKDKITQQFENGFII